MKKVLALIMVVLIVITGATPVLAAESDEYLTWTQKDTRWADMSIFDGDTIGRVGCFHTCLCILCAAADVELRDPAKFNPGVTSVDGRQIIAGWGTLGSGAPITFVGTGEMYSKSTPISTINSDIKGYIQQGYYVILRCVNDKYSGMYSELSSYGDVGSLNGSTVYPMHYVPVIGIANDGYPIVWDVAAAGDTYPKNQDGSGARVHDAGGYDLLGYIVQAYLYEPKEGYLSASESINSTSSAELLNKVTSASAVAVKNGLVTEKDLVGMVSPSFILDAQAPIILPDRSNLTTDELNTIGTIKDNMAAGEVTFTKVLHTVLSMLGVVLMIYAVVLWLSYVFDKVNAFFDFSLVHFFTLGTVTIVSAEDMGKEKVKGYTTSKVFFVKSIILFAVGVLLVSGVVVQVVEEIFSAFG